MGENIALDLKKYMGLRYDNLDWTNLESGSVVDPVQQNSDEHFSSAKDKEFS